MDSEPRCTIAIDYECPGIKVSFAGQFADAEAAEGSAQAFRSAVRFLRTGMEGAVAVGPSMPALETAPLCDVHQSPKSSESNGVGKRRFFCAECRRERIAAARTKGKPDATTTASTVSDPGPGEAGGSVPAGASVADGETGGVSADEGAVGGAVVATAGGGLLTFELEQLSSGVYVCVDKAHGKAVVGDGGDMVRWFGGNLAAAQLTCETINATGEFPDGWCAIGVEFTSYGFERKFGAVAKDRELARADDEREAEALGEMILSVVRDQPDELSDVSLEELVAQDLYEQGLAIDQKNAQEMTADVSEVTSDDDDRIDLRPALAAAVAQSAAEVPPAIRPAHVHITGNSVPRCEKHNCDHELKPNGRGRQIYHCKECAREYAREYYHKLQERKKAARVSNMPTSAAQVRPIPPPGPSNGTNGHKPTALTTESPPLPVSISELWGVEAFASAARQGMETRQAINRGNFYVIDAAQSLNEDGSARRSSRGKGGPIYLARISGPAREDVVVCHLVLVEKVWHVQFTGGAVERVPEQVFAVKVAAERRRRGEDED